MKKTLFLLILLATISCTKNEISESINDGKEMHFSNVHMSNNVTGRVAAPAGVSDEFGVYAYVQLEGTPSFVPYFENVKLSKTESRWELTTPYFYPSDNFDMNLLAYGTKYNINKPTSVGSTGLVYTNYSIDDQSTDELRAQYDNFVVSNIETVNNTETSTKSTTFKFRRALAKLNFSAKTLNAPSNIVTNISSIVLNTSSTGDLTYSASSSKWVPSSDKVDKNILLLDAKAEITDTTKPISTVQYVIPLGAVDGEANIFTVTVDFYNRNPDGSASDILIATNRVSYKMTPAQLVMGNNITYTIVVRPSAHGNGITFGEPTVEEWTDSDIK